MKTNKTLKKISGTVSGAGPVAAVLILSVVLAVSSETFLTVNNWMNILRQTAVNSTIAIGMLLILLTAGIDLSVGSICALSNCVMGALMRDLGVRNPVVLIAACLGCGLLCGYINGALYTKLNLPHPFVATLGTMQIFRGLAQIVSHATPITGFPDSVIALGFSSLGPIGFPACFIAVILVFILFAVLLNKTPLGKKIYAVGGTFVGALFIQIIRNGLNLLGAQSDLQMVVIGAVVIIAVVIDVYRGAAAEKAKRLEQAKTHQHA